MGEFLFIDMADVTLINDSIPLDQAIADGYDGSKNLLDHFVTTKFGLKAFQPTLFWTLKFLDTKNLQTKNSRYSDQIHFVDSVIIPGESLETDSADTALFDIRYPLVNRRSTKNQFTIGMYEDIYSSTEQIISEDIKKRSLNGGKHTDSTVDILVVGYLMRGAAQDNWNRYPRIAYFFDDCYPISIDDYKYDHTNQKWANVRNVTFAFRDYHFKTNVVNEEKTLVENYDTPHDETYAYLWTDNNEQNETTALKTTQVKNINVIGAGDYVVSKSVETAKDIEDRTWSNFTKKLNVKLLSDKANDPYSRMPGDHKIGLMDYDAGSSEKISKLGVSSPNIAINPDTYTNPYITEPKLREDLAHDKLDTQGAIEQYTSDYSVNKATSADKPAILKDWKFDTPIKSLEKDSLLTTVIKTAVRKFLIPDTPLYNSGHGMAWQPDFMKDVSKAIRKVQQIFYTEPKVANIPEEDHTTPTSHFGANKVSVDPDDTPKLDPFSKEGTVEIPYNDHIINHGPADTIKIDQNDFTRINEHGDPNNVNIDPDDHTTLEAHGDPNNVNIDPNDHTTLEAHGKPNNVLVDPNDHTTLEAHDEGNLAAIDPDDYTKLESHGQPNNVPIDPNDHTTHTSHATPNTVTIDPNDFVDSRGDVKANEIPIDPNDRLEQTKAVGKQVTIDQNDFADSENIKPNEVPIDKNDTPDAQNVSVNTKEIDEHDYVVSDGLKSNSVAIPKNDTPKSSDIETKSVTIDPNDFVSSEHKPANQNIVDIPTNDRLDEFGHKEAKTVSIPKDDTITKFTMPQNMVNTEDGYDRITKHEEKPSLVDISRNDIPDTEHISDRITKHRPEMSLMDFANMIANELKNDGNNRILKHENEGNIKENVPDPLLTHNQNAANILDRSKESDIINTLNRDKGHLVDVHQDDHTEIA